MQKNFAGNIIFMFEVLLMYKLIAMPVRIQGEINDKNLIIEKVRFNLPSRGDGFGTKNVCWYQKNQVRSCLIEFSYKKRKSRQIIFTNSFLFLYKK